jgi:CheY-like chemotaxis protein
VLPSRCFQPESAGNKLPDLILLVESEDIVRKILDTALAEAGFQVIFAFDAPEATAELRLNPALYRAVITDVRKANGPGSWDVAQRARELVEVRWPPKTGQAAKRESSLERPVGRR